MNRHKLKFNSLYFLFSLILISFLSLNLRAEDNEKPRYVKESVTVINSTSHEVTIKLESKSPNQKNEDAQFGPIKPKEKGDGIIGVWTNGSFMVHAYWKAEGKDILARTYTANLNPSDPLTPVTLTLTNPYGNYGLWSVAWEMPPGM